MENEELELTEQEAIRRAKLAKYIEKGIDPFGSKYDRDSGESKIKKQISANPIIDWLDFDVWLYLLGNNVDFNDVSTLKDVIVTFIYFGLQISLYFLNCKRLIRKFAWLWF